MDRKLCTILAMDVVGFSKMMSNDEVKTLEILKNRYHLEISNHFQLEPLSMNLRNNS